jgi:hypothetical protein
VVVAYIMHCGAFWHRPRGLGPVELRLLGAPHLLVVGAGNSRDPSSVRLRQEAKRGARRRRRRRDR